MNLHYTHVTTDIFMYPSKDCGVHLALEECWVIKSGIMSWVYNYSNGLSGTEVMLHVLE